MKQMEQSWSEWLRQMNALILVTASKSYWLALHLMIQNFRAACDRYDHANANAS